MDLLSLCTTNYNRLLELTGKTPQRQISDTGAKETLKFAQNIHKDKAPQLFSPLMIKYQQKPLMVRSFVARLNMDERNFGVSLL